MHPWSPILLLPNFQKRKIPNPVVVMGTIMKYQVWKRYGHCKRNEYKERERVWNHPSLHFIPWYFLPKFESPSMSMCYIYIYISHWWSVIWKIYFWEEDDKITKCMWYSRMKTWYRNGVGIRYQIDTKIYNQTTFVFPRAIEKYISSISGRGVECINKIKMLLFSNFDFAIYLVIDYQQWSIPPTIHVHKMSMIGF